MVLPAKRVGSWRWPCGFNLHIPLLLELWVYVVLVLGNEDGCPHHMQDCYTHDPCIGLRKLMVLTLNTHQIFK